jgi:hypothetical protein
MPEPKSLAEPNIEFGFVSDVRSQDVVNSAVSVRPATLARFIAALLVALCQD